MRPRDLVFESQSESCAAWHYEPEGGTGSPAPCVVMAHGLGGTRDSGLAAYAEQFASEGYHVLVFDYRHFGDSGGSPRQVLSIRRQLADWHAAVACARGLAGVDADQIALWGSSLSGGLVLAVAARNQRIAAVISQAPAMDGLAAVRTLVGHAGVGQLVRLTGRGLADAGRAVARDEPETVSIVGPPGTLAILTTPDAEPGYRAITGPTWRNAVAARVALALPFFRPGRRVSAITCPVLVQVCDLDSICPPTAAVHTAQRLGDRAELARYPIGHFDIYTGDGFEHAVGDQLAFLHHHLTTAGARRS
jgi:pimeloyl-ACP methyl ester carboxylesterase